jgi:PAS domain-containing protein
MMAIRTGAPSGAMELRIGPMMSSEQPDPELSETAQQINDLFDSAELSKAIETEEFKQFLDYIPIAIVVSKFFRGDQRICYANKAFETLSGQDTKDCPGKGWSILAGFKDENDLGVTLELAMLKGGEEFLGTFRAEDPRPLVVEAFSGLIQNEDGTENHGLNWSHTGRSHAGGTCARFRPASGECPARSSAGL